MYGINYLNVLETGMSWRKGDDSFGNLGSAQGNYEAEHNPEAGRGRSEVNP